MSVIGSMVDSTPDRPQAEREGMRDFDLKAAIERTEGCGIGVDSGCLLLVDPCYLPDDLLERLTNREYGAVIVPTGTGDGIFYAECTGDGVAIERG